MLERIPEIPIVSPWSCVIGFVAVGIDAFVVLDVVVVVVNIMIV